MRLTMSMSWNSCRWRRTRSVLILSFAAFGYRTLFKCTLIYHLIICKNGNKRILKVWTCLLYRAQLYKILTKRTFDSFVSFYHRSVTANVILSYPDGFLKFFWAEEKSVVLCARHLNLLSLAAQVSYDDRHEHTSLPLLLIHLQQQCVRPHSVPVALSSHFIH